MTYEVISIQQTMRWTQKSAFTIVELLIASTLSALLLVFMMVTIQKVIDQKQRENFKRDLLVECEQILDLLEHDWEQKRFSLGNLLLREPAYPVRYTYNPPQWSFEREDGKRLSYAVGMLPDGGYGLFQGMDTEETIFSLNNLLSENIIDLTVTPMECNENGWSPITTQDFIFDQGTLCFGDKSKIQYPIFLEIKIVALDHTQHTEYQKSMQQKEFLKANGVQMARLVPWYL